MRQAVGDQLLVGEVYLPSARWQPYLEHLDAAFAFELLMARWDAAPLRAAIQATTRRPGAAWVLSNHDFGRLVTRFGAENARSAALMLLTLPGPAFLYQGDEIGLGDGPGGERAFDRAGRDRFRHPMQWDASPSGGFTTGEPSAGRGPGAHKRRGAARRPRSTLTLVRDLLTLRRLLGDEIELLDAGPGYSPTAAATTAWPSTPPPRSGPRRSAATSFWRPSRARCAAARSRQLWSGHDGIAALPEGVELRQMADIKLDHVTKRFPDGYEAVRDMNLEIKDGEFMILVGPSGCGKSTALRMIAGLEEDITDGQLLIGGDVVNDRPPKDRDIAMVFQNYALYPHMSVRDNMGFALRLRGMDKEEINDKVENAARVLDLEPHLDRKPSQLSGGQRQRVAMGRAIVRDPPRS